MANILLPVTLELAVVNASSPCGLEILDLDDSALLPTKHATLIDADVDADGSQRNAEKDRDDVKLCLHTPAYPRLLA